MRKKLAYDNRVTNPRKTAGLSRLRRGMTCRRDRPLELRESQIKAQSVGLPEGRGYPRALDPGISAIIKRLDQSIEATLECE